MAEQTRSRTYEAARRYLAYGWPVIPLAAHDDLSFPEAERGKRPLHPGWQQYCSELPTKEDVVHWWEQTPDANAGLPCGTASG
ncbi:MAG: bifunctional DNA primase/polymerase, partial [bacterium]|nr:bifunctional DNA primase/polymerase [bacterium]